MYVSKRSPGPPATVGTPLPLPEAASGAPLFQSTKRTPSTFLSLPIEIRLDVYDFCFFQDIAFHTLTRRDTSWMQLAYPEYFRQFDLLLVNRQIHNEAREIAYAAQHRYLVQKHQTYYLSKPEDPRRDWILESSSYWQPSCRSAKALAGLQLPKLALAIRQPKYGCLKEQLSLLTDFLSRLVDHLDSKSNDHTTESLEIYLGGHHPTKIEILQFATEVLLTGSFLTSKSKPFQIIYLCCDQNIANEVDDYFVDSEKKARMYYWEDAPDGLGARYPADFKEPDRPQVYSPPPNGWGGVESRYWPTAPESRGGWFPQLERNTRGFGSTR